jgi:hypothetical protein
MTFESVHADTRRAWGRRSLAWLLILTGFLFVTGLGVLLLPFSKGTQVTVLAHTAGGLLFLVPLFGYLVPHFRERFRDKYTHLLLLGYMAGAVLATVVLSGIVLTVEAAFGRGIGYGWDLAHIITGCACAVLILGHMLPVIRKNRPGEWPYVMRLLVWTNGFGILLSVASFLGGAAVPDSPRRMALPEKYGFRYGENPFAPSMAKTDLLARMDQDRRWIETLEDLRKNPANATPERLAEFLKAAEHGFALDRECSLRGEEVLGLGQDRARIDALRAAAAAPAEAKEREISGLVERVKAELEGRKREFDARGGIHPDALAGSKSCGTAGCHEEILREWEPSAHRYASRSAFFQLIQGAMAEANGAESTRYCAGCHDPIALFSGAKNIYDEDLSSPGADEGISCASCHSIVRTDVLGNANFTITPPVRYLAEESFLGRFLIRAYPQHHKASYGRPLLQTPEFCGACHKQFIDKDINRSTRVQLQNQYDAWKGSHWFVADEKNPQRPDGEKTLACRDCHMRLRDSQDPVAARKEGRHRHHAFIAANQWLPALHGLPHADEQIRLTEEWLRGETVIPEIADRWPAGPIVPLEIEAPAAVRPGETVKIRVVADNRKVGHTFPTGPLDVIQSWIEVKATLDGKTVFHSGMLDDRGFIQPGSFIFKSEGVDRAGNLIDRHNLWDMVGSRFRRMLFPGHSDREEYVFACEDGGGIAGSGEAQEFAAPDAPGRMEITALLRYRKVDQTLLNMLRPDGKSRAPVTTMTTVTKVVDVVRRP